MFLVIYITHPSEKVATGVLLNGKCKLMLLMRDGLWRVRS